MNHKSKVQMRNCTALEGEGQQWIAAPAWMASTEQEAKGSLEISALTSAKFLQNQERKTVVGLRGLIIVINYCLLFKWSRSYIIKLDAGKSSSEKYSNKIWVHCWLQFTTVFSTIDISTVSIKLEKNSFQKTSQWSPTLIVSLIICLVYCIDKMFWPSPTSQYLVSEHEVSIGLENCGSKFNPKFPVNMHPWSNRKFSIWSMQDISFSATGEAHDIRKKKETGWRAYALRRVPSCLMNS